MSLQAIGPLYNFPLLGSPTWSIVGATLNDGTTIDDLNHGPFTSAVASKLYFGKNAATDSHSFSTELYLNDPNYCGLYTMSIAISHSECSYTDVTYIKMVSLSLDQMPDQLNYCIPLPEDDADGMVLEGPATNANGVWSHVDPPTPGISPGYPHIAEPNMYKSALTQQPGSHCIYKWTQYSSSVHELDGENYSVTCYAEKDVMVSVDENPGQGTWVLPDTDSWERGPLETNVFYIGGGGCCPANNEKFISRSFEAQVPGLAINTDVTVSVFNNLQYGYDDHTGNELRGVVMGFGSGSGTGASGLDSYNRIIQNSRSSFGYNATNSAFSHSEDVINSSNISTFGSYTSSFLWFRSEFSSSYGQPISMSFSTPGELGICQPSTTANLVPLIPFNDFQVTIASASNCEFIKDKELGIDCIKVANVCALSFQTGGVAPQTTESTVLTQQGKDSDIDVDKVFNMGGGSIYATLSYQRCEDVSNWAPVVDWMNLNNNVPPRYAWADHPLSCSAFVPRLGSTAYWPTIHTASDHIYEWGGPQVPFRSGSGIVTSSHGNIIMQGDPRLGGNHAYHPEAGPQSYYGSPDGVLFTWRAQLLMGYDVDGQPDYDSTNNQDYWGCFADTWRPWSHFEAPTYFPPIRNYRNEDGGYILLRGWPNDWGNDSGSLISGPNYGGVYGRPSNYWYSASVMFQVTCSPINRPDMTRYASCSVMFVSCSPHNDLPGERGRSTGL